MIFHSACDVTLLTCASIRHLSSKIRFHFDFIRQLTTSPPSSVGTIHFTDLLPIGPFSVTCFQSEITLTSRLQSCQHHVITNIKVGLDKCILVALFPLIRNVTNPLTSNTVKPWSLAEDRWQKLRIPGFHVIMVSVNKFQILNRHLITVYLNSSGIDSWLPNSYVDHQVDWRKQMSS